MRQMVFMWVRTVGVALLLIVFGSLAIADDGLDAKDGTYYYPGK
jgi:hypothetical protein